MREGEVVNNDEVPVVHPATSAVQEPYLITRIGSNVLLEGIFDNF
ncbi:hypothetical protein [Flavobacterium cyanobacteriorum]|nr:hypothetical protein [Flavobacterium cyanobacteriorum]